MYAIIQDGGRQYRVVEGQILELDFRDVEAGTELTFERVLAVSDADGLRAGKPTLDDCSVSAKVLGARLGDKVHIQKMRRRKNSRRRTGFRPVFTRVQIEKIS